MLIKINYEVFKSGVVVIAFLIALISIIFTWIDHLEKTDDVKKNHKERNKKITFYRIRVFFTSILGLIAVYQAYSHKDDEYTSSLHRKSQDSTINAKQDSIKAITTKLDSMSNKLNKKNDALMASQKNINSSQALTIQLQDELYKQVTGANSIAFLQLQLKGLEGFDANEKEVLQLRLLNYGNYPIENVSLNYYQIEEKRPKAVPPRPKNYVNQPPRIRILIGEPKNTVHISNVHLYAGESKTIESFTLNYDTTDLISSKWSVSVFWRNVKYMVDFKIFPPPKNSENWKIDELKISCDGKTYTEEQLIAYLQKKLKVK